MQNVKKLFPQAFMTMAAEIKNRVGPPAAAQPGAAGESIFTFFPLDSFLKLET